MHRYRSLRRSTGGCPPVARIHRNSGGLQVVRVPTARGWVVLASDSTHFWANIRTRSPFPIVVAMARMLEGYDIVESLADGPDHIIPGHDPLVLSRFPGVPGLRDVVRLDLPPVGEDRRPSRPLHEGDGRRLATVYGEIEALEGAVPQVGGQGQDDVPDARGVRRPARRQHERPAPVDKRRASHPLPQAAFKLGFTSPAAPPCGGRRTRPEDWACVPSST
jgi:hypothetical protein